MVALSETRAANAALVTSQPLVAVFIGATSGIGEYTVKALASTHGKNGKGLRAYIIGRNQKAAEETIAECLTSCPNGEFIFLPANDLSLLKDVDEVSAEITKQEQERSQRKGDVARTDILVMTQAFFNPFEGRLETKEGLDKNLSLLYYSRARFATNLLPLLEASTLPAHIVSVYAAGMEDKLFLDDLDLRKNFSFSNQRSHAVYMKTLFFQRLTREHPGKISFVHVYPGLVLGPGFYRDTPKWLQIIWRWLGEPLGKLFSTPPDEAGERVLYLATKKYEAASINDAQQSTSREVPIGTDGRIGSGAYAVNIKGEVVPTQKAYAKYEGQDLEGKIWSHTQRAFGEIEAGRVVKD